MSEARGSGEPADVETPRPAPSATVVLLREASQGPELLLLQRAPRKGRPGPWVFPGGKVEAADGPTAPPPRAAAGAPPAAVRAAVRETREETGLALAPRALAPIARWITPPVAPRRFDTWFFLAVTAGREPVRVDGGEIVDHRWVAPGDALEAHHGGTLRLAPPQFVTVSWLAGYAGPGAAARAHAELGGAAELPVFRPRICPLFEGACMLYPGDAGYEAHDPDLPGPRHRLWAVPPRWRYERGG